MSRIIRIATRESQLALWQANYVKNKLEKLYPEYKYQLTPMTSEGDQIKGSLSAVGGKALFAKNIQQAVLENKADIAVHSMKDLSVNPTAGLIIAAVCEREDPRDVLISNTQQTLATLPAGAKVGTGSPRRRNQLLNKRPDINCENCRGNLQTRLKKLDDGEFDAIILAAAGIHRLQYQKRISEYLSVESFIPAIAQAALAVECRDDDHELIAQLKKINHADSLICVDIERGINQILGGDCHSAIGAYAWISNEDENENKDEDEDEDVDNKIINVRAMVGDESGKTQIYSKKTAPLNMASDLKKIIADDLIQQGAFDLLNKI